MKPVKPLKPVIELEAGEWDPYHQEDWRFDVTRARYYLGNLFPEEDFDQSELTLGAPRKTSEARIAALEEDAERICMTLRGLIDALIQRKIISPQALKALILEIDKSDGLVSGGTTVVPVRRQGIDKPPKISRNR